MQSTFLANLQKNSFWLGWAAHFYLEGRIALIALSRFDASGSFFIAEATSLNRTGQPSMSFPYKNAQSNLTLEPHGPRAW